MGMSTLQSLCLWWFSVELNPFIWSSSQGSGRLKGLLNSFALFTSNSWLRGASKRHVCFTGWFLELNIRSLTTDATECLFGCFLLFSVTHGDFINSFFLLKNWREQYVTRTLRYIQGCSVLLRKSTLHQRNSEPVPKSYQKSSMVILLVVRGIWQCFICEWHQRQQCFFPRQDTDVKTSKSSPSKSLCRYLWAVSFRVILSSCIFQIAWSLKSRCLVCAWAFLFHKSQKVIKKNANSSFVRICILWIHWTDHDKLHGIEKWNLESVHSDFKWPFSDWVIVSFSHNLHVSGPKMKNKHCHHHKCRDITFAGSKIRFDTPCEPSQQQGAVWKYAVIQLQKCLGKIYRRDCEHLTFNR